MGKAVDAMIGAVYNILEEYRFNNKQCHVPIDVIKQRVMKSKNVKLWKKVDAMQKKCLSLTAVQNLNNSNDQNAFSNPSWSNSPHGQQQQQQAQSWNFNNQNEGTGYRRGASQADDVSEQTRFP